jgi:hypothetical protein
MDLVAAIWARICAFSDQGLIQAKPDGASVADNRREVPGWAPFLNEAVLDRAYSMEWLSYRGPESSASSPAPAWADLAVRNEVRRPERFPWYGKRMAKSPSRSKRPMSARWAAARLNTLKRRRISSDVLALNRRN